MKQRIYYDCSDDEIKDATDPDDAIECYLEGLDYTDTIPTELTAHAFVPIEVTEAEKVTWSLRLVEWLHEEADQDHAHNEFDTLDKKQIAALQLKAREFVDAFFAEYRASYLERAPEHDVTVDVLEWIRENDAEWYAEIRGRL